MGIWLSESVVKPFVWWGCYVTYFLGLFQKSAPRLVDRLQIVLVATNIYIYVSQLFVRKMPKMRAIPQLVSAPLNPYQLQNILGGATHHVSTVTDNTYK